MNVMRLAARPRSPAYPPGIPTEEIASYERASSIAYARVDVGDNPTLWAARVKEHRAKLGGSAAAVVHPQPHSCSHCQKLVVDVSHPITFDWSGKTLHPKYCDLQCSLREARVGAENGCDFLQQVLSQWSPSDPVEGNEENYRLFAYGHVDNEDAEYDLLVLANIGMIDTRKGWSKWDNANHSDNDAPLASMDIYAEGDDLASEFVQNRPITVDPWSSQTKDTIRLSLANCFRHSEAIENETVQIPIEQAPARLLAISKTDDGWSLRLEQVEIATPKYCTLSYCWGPTQSGFTTLSNLEGRGTHVEFSAVSKTIQDAIIVCWDLGICHLWVDALCIIQDSEIDKAVEISKMSHIYTNAYVTICTSRTLFADEGFLHHREPFLANSARYRLAYQIPHQERHGSIVLYQSSDYSGDNRLETRAWGFQERVLSRRILDFDGTTTEFSCCHFGSDLSHSHRDGGPSNHARDWAHMDWHRRLLVQFDGVEDDRMAIKDVVDLWSDIARQYTGRSVTNATDRALAISAIAERFAKYTKDEYIGGLWKRTLPWSLMWCMRMRRVRLPRPGRIQGTYQGPSWSWLGINGPVHFFHAKELFKEGAEVTVEYVAHEVDPRYSTALYGTVNSASIALKGRTRRARWIRNNKPSTTTAEDYDLLAIHGLDRPDWSKHLEANLSDGKDCSGLSGLSEELLPAKILPDALEPEFALPVASGGSTELDVILVQMFKRDGIPIGLALRDPGEDNDGFYERVGIFYMEERKYIHPRGDEGDKSTSPEDTEKEKEVEKNGSKSEGKGNEQPGDNDEDFDELLSRGWEFAEHADDPSGIALLHDVKPHLERIGKVLENEVQKKIQDEREAQLWERWKGWFDEDDNEDQVLVLV